MHMCMFVCVCVYLSNCYIYIYTHAYAYVRMCVYACAFVCVYAIFEFMYISMCALSFTWMFRVWKHLFSWVFLHTYKECECVCVVLSARVNAWTTMHMHTDLYICVCVRSYDFGSKSESNIIYFWWKTNLNIKNNRPLRVQIRKLG